MCSFKIKAILRAESKWSIIELETTSAAFPIIVDGKQLTKIQFKKKKNAAWSLIILSVSNDIVDLVVGFINPTLA